MSPPNPYPMIAFPPSQLLGAQIAARPSLPLSPRSPTLRRSAAAYYSASAADLPSSLLTQPTPSLYDVLGVANEATSQEIRSAYRCLARTCHPDTAAGGRGGASADEFMRIHAAYTTLSDPGARADYNRKLMRIHRHRHSAAKAAPFAGGYAGRSWETDQCW